jgi:hypothetical protein
MALHTACPVQRLFAAYLKVRRRSVSGPSCPGALRTLHRHKLSKSPQKSPHKRQTANVNVLVSGLCVCKEARKPTILGGGGNTRSCHQRVTSRTPFSTELGQSPALGAQMPSLRPVSLLRRTVPESSCPSALGLSPGWHPAAPPSSHNRPQGLADGPRRSGGGLSNQQRAVREIHSGPVWASPRPNDLRRRREAPQTMVTVTGSGTSYGRLFRDLLLAGPKYAGTRTLG